MSIASEITRLQTAKADLKTSIESKGVTVPSATTLDGYANLVNQISSGGGSNNYVEGTFTINSATSQYNLTSVIKPKMIAIIYSDPFSGSGLVTIGWTKSSNGISQTILVNLGNSTYTFKNEDYVEFNADGTLLKRFGSYNLPAGTYKYAACI